MGPAMPAGAAGGAAPLVAVEAMTRALGDIALAAAAATTQVGAMGVAITAMVGKANPAVAQQFTLAINDTLAVIGQALTPVLKVATEILRMFADTILAFGESVGGTLGAVFESLVPAFEAMFTVFAQIGGVVAEAFKAVAPLILLVMRGITNLFEWISDMIGSMLAFAGVEAEALDVKKGAAVGAAVRTANKSSVEDVISQAQKAAYSLGTAAKDPAGRTASAAEAIKARADAIWELIKRLPRDIAEWLGKVLDKGREAVAGLFDTPEERHAKATARARDDPEFRRLDEEAERLKALRATRDLLLGMATGGAFDVEKRRRAAARAGGDGPGVVKPDGP